MKNLRLLSYSLLSAAVLLLAAGCGTDNDINISISETDDELVVAARYPEKESKRVHQYVKTKLRMTDISDFNHLEIKEYQPPHQRMNFHIKSRDGYLKIVLDKKENTMRSYERLKDAGKGLQKLLAQR